MSLLVLALSAPASAAAQGARERTIGRELFREGVERARAGDWETARDRFSRAYELTQHAPILINLAAAEAQLGHLVEASDAYQRYLSDEDARADMRSAAESALEALQPRIPRLTVRLVGAERGDEVLLDGRPLPRAALGAAMPINPGRHEVSVRRGGAVVARREGTLEEGQREVADIDLRAESAAGNRALLEPSTFRPEPTATTATAAASLERDEDEESAPWWPWALGGAAVIGVVVVLTLIFASGDETIPDGYDGNLGRFRPADGTVGNLGSWSP